MIETTRALERSAMSAPLPRKRSHPERVLSIAVMVGALFVAVFALGRGPESAIALLLLCGTIVAASIRPICGLYSIVLLTLVGDVVTVTWYPFAKNLSSGESILYLSDNLTLSPLEILVGATFAFWTIDVAFTPGRRVNSSPLVIPIAVFTAFVGFGFLRGVGAGGDLRIALFEGRSMFLILPVFLLTLNLCDQGQLRRLMWTAVTGVFLNALLALNYLNHLTSDEEATRQDLGEHSASVQFAFILLLTLTMLLYRAGTRLNRLVLLASCLPVVLVFFEAQRRSSVVGAGVGLVLIVVSLGWRDRTKFLIVAPLVTVVTVGYTAAFWNSESSAAFPAGAIKTVVAPDDSSEKDRSSDLYRNIENFNINYTIRSSPVIGLGFGHRFLRPVPLADISSFEFYEYIPHNSIAWVWIKTGFFGFVSLLTVFAVAVREGARQVVSAADPMIAVMAMIGVVNVIMFAVYAFVDIAWDPRGMVFLALSLALCVTAWHRPESLGRAT